MGDARRFGLTAGLVAAISATVLTACSAADADVTGDGQATPSPATVDVASYQSQAVEWGSCSFPLRFDGAVESFAFDQAQCARVDVPATYDQVSDLDDLTIQLMRLPATDPQQRIGSLFINPGGPGGSGVGFLQWTDWPTELRAKYDIVGFDPRGVGASTPMKCQSDSEKFGSFFTSEASPRDLDEWRAEMQRGIDFFEDCRQSDPRWWTITTNNAVHDLDILRAVVGDEQLSFYGTSYGSVLGSQYLTEYPENAGRMVLDSPWMGYQQDPGEAGIAQNKSIEEALLRYVRACGEDPECAYPSEQAVRDALVQAVAQIDDGQLGGFAGPVVSPVNHDWRVPSESLFLAGLLQITYFDFDSAYPYVRDALNELQATGRVGYFEYQGLQYHRFDPDTKKRVEQGPDAGYLYRCLDRDLRRTPAEIDEQERALAEAAPFAHLLNDVHGYQVPQEELAQYRLGCQASWAAFDDPQIPDPPANLPLPTNTSGHPILLVGTTGDNATPYADAVEMAGLLESPLLTYNGTGHANGMGKVPCLTEKVTAYLTTGELPPDGASCG